MSTDWQAKEREFLTGLEADTGHDLAGWMRRIAAQNLPHRNDIIDWLRQQGFPFARASWLERIHHNAGRPIYIDASELLIGAEVSEVAEAEIRAAGGMRVAVAAAGRAAPTMPRPEPAEMEMTSTPAPVAAAARPAEVPAAPAPPPFLAAVELPTPGSSASAQHQPEPPPAPPSSPKHHLADTTGDGETVAAVIAKAKAYRPLAAHLVRAIELALPGVEIEAASSHLTLSRAGRRFGVLAVSSKDLRLVLALPGTEIAPPWQPVKLQLTLARPAEGMTHMLVLNDARQVDDRLINLLVQAAAG